MNTIPVVCISLKKDSDRRATFIKSCEEKSAGFREIFFFEAIDGGLLSDELKIFFERVKNILSDKNREMTSGEIGCFFSHLLVWSNFMSGKYGSGPIIVVEDDVIFKNKTPFSCGSLIKQDFAFLAMFPKSNSEKIYARASKYYYDLIGPSYHYTRACAYLVSKNWVESALVKVINNPFVIDDWERYLANDYARLYPIFVHPTTSVEQSNIEGERNLKANIKPGFYIRKKRRIKVLAIRLLTNIDWRIQRLSTLEIKA